jgi:hypothetical protein
MARILFLTPLSSTTRAQFGRFDYPMNLAKAVARQGQHEVSLATVDDVQVVESETLESRLTLHRMPLAVGRRSAEPVSWRVTELVRDADLLHIDRIFARASEVATLAGVLAAKPICASDFGSQPVGNHLGAGVLALVNVLCTPFRHISSGGVAPTSIEMIPLPIDTEFFCPAEPGHSSTASVVLFGPAPGASTPGECAPPGLEILVCPPELAGSEMRSLLRRALAFVVTPSPSDFSERAHLGLCAMACGVPVICHRRAALTEVVRSGETGFVTECQSDIPARLEQLADDHVLRQEMGRQAREAVCRSCGLDAVGVRLGSVYEQLLERFEP